MSLLTFRRADGSSAAWYGVRVTAALDLPCTVGHAELTPADRAESAHQQDLGYLLRQLRPEPGLAVEARWLAGGGQLALHLLGRVTGASEQAARELAERAAVQLAALPGHVVGERVTDPGELRHALAPFAPHPAGLAEIRRGCATAEPSRPDAGVRYYVAVPPLHPAPERMPALLHRLVSHPAPVMFTVGLEPSPVPAGFSQALARIAEQYGRLAQPGELARPGIYGSVRQPLAPDPFAALAGPLFADAARRYQGLVFRLRVALASPEPFDDSLADAVGDALGAVSLPGASPYAVHRPRHAAENTALGTALVTLGVPRWECAPASPLPAALRALTEIADPVEASAAFWLPAAADGALPGFPTVPPPAEQHAARNQTVYAEGATHNEFYDKVDVRGDFVARDKVEGQRQ